MHGPIGSGNVPQSWEVGSAGAGAAHAQRYGEAAERIARGVIADEARRSAVFGCELSGDDGTCLRALIRSFGHRAFRRPLTEGADPDFLFRPEEGVESDREGLVRLNGFEIAIRLAFFFTGRPPTAELLDCAAEGELDNAESVETLARDMLDTPEAVEAVRQFYSASAATRGYPGVSCARAWRDRTRAACASLHRCILRNAPREARSTRLRARALR